MQKINISEIKLSFRVRFDDGSIAELADDIKQHGMLHPILITPEKTLLAGYRRLKAAELLGWKEVPVVIISAQDILTEFDIQLAENMKRKNLNAMEISEAILERKRRFEQVYGKIEHGGDRKGEVYQEIKFSNGKLDRPNFYEETGKLLQMSEISIYRFLELQDLDQDLKEQVQNGKLPYRNALAQQAERKRSQKSQVQKKKQSLNSIRLPNAEQAALLQAQYDKAPNLMNLFMLINHTWHTVQQTKEKPLEYDRFELEFLYGFVQRLEEVIPYYQEILSQLHQTQEKKLLRLAAVENVT